MYLTHTFNHLNELNSCERVLRAYRTCRPEKRISCKNRSPLICTVSNLPLPLQCGHILSSTGMFFASHHHLQIKNLVSIFTLILTMSSHVITQHHTSKSHKANWRARTAHWVQRQGYWLGYPEFNSKQGKEAFFESGLHVTLTTHLQLLPKLILCGAVPVLPYTSAWHGLTVQKQKNK